MNKETLIKCRAVILHQGKLLLVKHPHDTSFSALPGGHLEWGENLQSCLERELVEELGIKPKIGRLLYVNNYSQTDGKHYIEFFFEVLNGEDYANSNNAPTSHAYELAEKLWISPEDDVRILPEKFNNDFKENKLLSETVKYIS